MRRLPATLARQIYAAAEPIADNGLDHTKIDDIADATGVPKATLYYYFSGKEEILSFLLADMLRLVEGEVAVAAAAAGSARDRLTAVVKAQVKAMFDHPAVCRALLGEFGRASSVPEIAAAIRGAFHIPIERLLREGERDGSLRHLEDPADAATAVFGAVTFNALNHLVEHDQADPQAVASAALDVLITGLRPAGSAATSRSPRATRPGTSGA
jgi:AcrR family transcriptional regulator